MRFGVSLSFSFMLAPPLSPVNKKHTKGGDRKRQREKNTEESALGILPASSSISSNAVYAKRGPLMVHICTAQGGETCSSLLFSNHLPIIQEQRETEPG